MVTKIYQCNKMHEPETPIQLNSSTQISSVGAAAASDLTAKFFTEPGPQTLTWDQMVDMPFLARTMNISSSNSYGDLLTEFDPWENPRDPDQANEQGNPLPIPLLYLLSAHYYDYEPELTFWAIKHERARGQIMFVFVPFNNLSEVQLGTIAPDTTKYQKWLWDIEKQDMFTLRLVGTKYVNYRSRVNMAGEGDTNYTMIFDSRKGGTLIAFVFQPYNAGNVGSDTCTILCFNRLQNLQSMEYRSFSDRIGWRNLLTEPAT